MSSDATVTRPPSPQPPGKRFAYVAVPAEGWRVAAEGARCRYSRGVRDKSRCPAGAVAEKEVPGDAIWPWRGYCPRHMGLNWVEDGQVMTWDLRRKGREDEPLTAAETARLLGGTDGMCAQHHCRRGECPPESRHGHTMRFRDDDWEQWEQAARPTVTARIEQLMQAAGGWLRCPRCRDTDPPVPVTLGDLSGGLLGDWITAAAEQVRLQHPRHQPVAIGAETAALAVPFRPPAVTP